MKVIVIGVKPGEIEVREIDMALSTLQSIVDGYIEPCAPVELTDWNMELLCNEEGLLKGLEPNQNLFPFFYAGTAVIVGVDEEDFAGLSDFQIQFAFEWLKGLPEYQQKFRASIVRRVNMGRNES